MNYNDDMEEKHLKPPKKKKSSFIRIFVMSVASVLVLLILAAIISPVPVSLVVRFAFRNGLAIAPENYEEIASKVSAIKDILYPSEYEDNIADIFLPKNQEGKAPVVLWVHGGAFVGGSKKDVEIYATMLASEGIAVVSINYQRAPERKYPGPVIQTEEAYRWLVDVADTYDIDQKRIILAGDSAGAHIVSQFAAVQTNKNYADIMGMEQVVPADTLKAVVLFCGPFDVESINKTDNSILDFLLGRTAWAYFGMKNWADEFSDQVAISNHITSDFPPTFISDGNTSSFEDHGRALAADLEDKGVPVETFFVSADDEVTMHEYQFIMNTAAGQESFKKTVDFMKKYLG